MALFISDKKSGHREIFQIIQSINFLQQYQVNGCGRMVGHWLHKHEVPGSIPCAGITFCLKMLENLTKIVVTGDQLFNFQLYLSVSHFKDSIWSKFVCKEIPCNKLFCALFPRFSNALPLKRQNSLNKGYSSRKR